LSTDQPMFEESKTLDDNQNGSDGSGSTLADDFVIISKKDLDKYNKAEKIQKEESILNNGKSECLSTVDA